MNRVIEFLKDESEIFDVVVSYRVRSVVLFFVALVIPFLMMLSFVPMLQAFGIPGWADSVRPVLGISILFVTLKFVALAFHTYLTDRAKVLRL